ncbi:MAG: AGE family epimerase/isomerase [Caldilineales bacterium]|nr:AGE family epimerase/isomerase [Caldilineales bacterium]
MEFADASLHSIPPEQRAMLIRLSHEARQELDTVILPFYENRAIDHENGGFYGRIDANGVPVRGASKGAVLNTRLLWTFSRVYRLNGDPYALRLLERALEQVRDHFWDAQYGGVFWTLDASGGVEVTHKDTYAQSFAIYALAEHHLATGDEESKASACHLFELLDARAYDRKRGGFVPALRRSWRPGWRQLLRRPEAWVKTQNLHVHLLESFTPLYGIWPDAALQARLGELVSLHIDVMYDPARAAFRPDFSRDWKPTKPGHSYGHDIETAWLLWLAVCALRAEDRKQNARAIALAVADQIIAHGMLDDGQVVFAAEEGHWMEELNWWVQAEAIVGFLHAYELSANASYLTAAGRVWDFVRANLSDPDIGEWQAGSGDAGRAHERMGMWKGPYHNGRACVEIIERCDKLLATGVPNSTTDV